MAETYGRTIQHIAELQGSGTTGNDLPATATNPEVVVFGATPFNTEVSATTIAGTGLTPALTGGTPNANAITVNQPGWYRVTARLTAKIDATKIGKFYLYKNGAALSPIASVLHTEGAAAETRQITLEKVLWLETNDYVSIYIDSDANTGVLVLAANLLVRQIG
jgi:hypothetical protein